MASPDHVLTTPTSESPDSVLLALKQKLGSIMDVLDRRRRIIYIDYPLHRNIGDLLINQGTEKFFTDNGLTVKRRYNLYDLPKMIPDVQPNDMFLFHGGGNLGDLYPEHLDAVASVIEQFPNNQVVQFPQTVYFSSDEQREQRAKMLRKHPDTTIFVRDTRSLVALQEANIPNVVLMPDMAHQLFGKLVANPRVPTKKELYFCRKDVEAGTLPPAIAPHKEEGVDWDDCIDLTDRLTCAACIRIVKLTRTLGHAMDIHSMWYPARDGMVHSGIRLLSEPAAIYTNRLHAMLLGLLIGREVRWFDNTYGKLSAYVDTWLQGISTISRVE